MTCIVGVASQGQGVVIGADSETSDNGRSVIMPGHKIRRIGDMVVAGAGLCGVTQVGLDAFELAWPDLRSATGEERVKRMLGVLRDAAREAGCLAKANDDMVNLDGSCFLVGIGDQLWRISPWFSRHRDARGVDALGSGRDIAIGVAWTMRARGAWDAVVLALHTAEEFSEGVRRPFTILETTT